MNGRINQAYEAAQLYYVQDMTMDGIANRLGVSRATVSRLLKSARETGMVQIRLDDSFRVRSELERRISERYKTRVSLVNTRADATPIAVMGQVARTAAQLLDSLIDDGTSVGVAWGATVTEVSRHLPRRPLNGVKIVQLNGAGNAHHTGIPYLDTLLGRLVTAYDAYIVHFPVPAFFDYADTKDAMWQLCGPNARLTWRSLVLVLSVGQSHRMCTLAGISMLPRNVHCVSRGWWGIYVPSCCEKTARGRTWR